MKRTKVFGVLLAVIVAAVTLCACGAGGGGDKVAYPDSKTICFVAHDEPKDITGQLYNSLKKLEEPKGYEVVFSNADGSTNLQLDQFNEAIAMNPVAIVVLAVDGEAIIPAIKRANEKGIPVIATNRDVYGGKFTNVINDEKMGGTLQGEYFAKHLPQGATVVYLTGDIGVSCAVDRWIGFKEACLDKRPDITLLARTSAGDWSNADGVKNMAVWMKLFPKIDAVASGNDNMVYGARKMMEAAGRADGVLYAGVDATTPVLQCIEEGKMQITVKQDVEAITAKISELIDDIAKGNPPPEGNVLVPLIGITKDNVAQYK